MEDGIDSPSSILHSRFYDSYAFRSTWKIVAVGRRSGLTDLAVMDLPVRFHPDAGPWDRAGHDDRNGAQRFRCHQPGIGRSKRSGCNHDPAAQPALLPAGAVGAASKNVGSKRRAAMDLVPSPAGIARDMGGDQHRLVE